MNYAYLHGWGSSPDSLKARWFEERFRQTGLELNIPDFNRPDFFNISLSRQIQQTLSLFDAHPVTLIGSSFGGLTALWAAQRSPQVERLVLLAPAVNFRRNALRQLGEERYRQWQQQGHLPVYHQAFQRELELGFDFVEDLTHYPDSGLDRQLPTLILHGRDDPVIPLRDAQYFAATRPWVRLVELDSDHSLGEVQQPIWQAVREFCSLPV